MSRLPRRLAKVGFPIEFMGSVMDKPRTVATETPGPQKVSAPEPRPAKPRPPAPAEPLPRDPDITPWTEADITPDAPAAPAAETSGPSKVTGQSKGFKSRAQWRKFFADPRLRRFARRKAHASKGGPKVRYRVLPERKGPPSAGSAR